MRKRLRKKNKKKLINDIAEVANIFDAQPVSMVNRMIWYEGQMYRTDNNGELMEEDDR